MPDITCPEPTCREDLRDCISKKLERLFFWKVIGGFLLGSIAIYGTSYVVYSKGQDKRDEAITLSQERTQKQVEQNAEQIHQLSLENRDTVKDIEYIKRSQDEILIELKKMNNKP